MKKTLIILIAILLTIVATGCTMQFKAKEIELEGHTYTEYDFEKFAWTQPTPSLIKPAE